MATHQHAGGGGGGGGGGGAGTVSRHRKFFKVLLPGSFEISLCLPPKFVTGLACRPRHSATATLWDPAGRSWTVDLEQQHPPDGMTFFSGGGWRGFVAANGICAGDMLVFEHHCGGLEFAVDLFSPSGCLKTTDDDGATACHEEQRVVQEHVNVNTTEVTGDKESGNGCPEAPPRTTSSAKRRKLQSPPGSTSTTTASCETLEGRQQRRDDETLLRLRIEKPYQLRLLDVSKSFCDRVGWTASRNVELCCAARGDVATAERRRWPVSVKVTAKGGMLCGGWTEFAKDNGLKLNDACVFLPSSSSDGHVFHVHVLTPTP